MIILINIMRSRNRLQTMRCMQTHEGHTGATFNQQQKVGENLHLPSENYSHVYQFPAESTAPPYRTVRSGRGVPHQGSRSGTAVHPAPPQLSDNSQHHELRTSTPTAIRRNVEAAEESRTHRRLEEKSADGSEQAKEEGEKRMDVMQASEQLPSPSEGSEPQHTEQSHPQPNMVEPLSDHRGIPNMRNHSDSPHLPGDHLFEIAVELNFSQDLEESWDNEARSLLLSVKNMISKQLEILHTPLSISSKRIKRLNAGVLYILWLQIGQEPGGLQVHRVIHSALQNLIAAGVGLRGNHRKAVILSVSTADVNECGTQLVLCDINADCVNRFGSYSCHCRPGFQDESRLGSGGTNCVDVKAAGCSSGLSSEAKGVYVLFFLLSSLILMLLVAAGMIYRRHHQGTFLVRCHSSSSISSPDHNNNNHHHPDDGYSSPTDCDLPPPPPPVRGPREAWGQVKGHGPAVDLPLLRFSPLLPPDSYIDPQEGGKM
uniref:EGF-like domain-containing protein n=1 Tax=Amphiprion ocellaris TaxID=80972 RepID=A0AAQ5ZEU7_AMPOC